MTLPPFSVGRRATVLGAAALVAAPSLARAASAARLPCPSRPGEIAGLLLQGSGGPSGAVAVFGHAFRPGDLPAGHALEARLTQGGALPVQIDIRNRHADGSVRLALVAMATPALADGQVAGVMLSARPGQQQAASPPQPSGRQAVVEVTGPGGETWRLDLLPRALRGRPWQSGPLAVQGRVEALVPPSSAGGVTSLRLVADVSLHADGALRLDAWFRNDLAMRSGGGAARYTARLLLDGKPVGRFEIPHQPQYTAWGRLFVSRPGGPPPLVRQDPGYLADAGAVARYNAELGVDEALLARLGAATATPAWAQPLGPRLLAQDMYQPGGRPDIGPATQAQAAWLVSGDRRAAAFAIGQAEAAGSAPWHFWDPAGGSGNGGWLDTRRWPQLWIDGRGGPPPGGLMQPVASDTGWAPDVAHQPDLGFVPYLLTGRRAFLDQLQAQAAWCVVAQWPRVRGNLATQGPGEGVNVVRTNQVRGSAWSLRQLDNAAWASDEDDPNLPYLRTCSEGNWAWLRSRTAGWSREQGELRGCIPGAYGTPGMLPPWQQDYFASTAASAARRGNPDARHVLEWMSNFLVGRFMAKDKGFDPHDGVAYLIASDPGAGEGETRPLRSWAETARAMRAAGLSNDGGWSKTEGDYAQLALQSLAALIDVTGSADARRAYAWLAGVSAPFTRPQDFRRDPTFSIVPRGAGRCG
ncbi:hypothetical protein MHZ93_21355 [Roseomonas sp. ACRSG]|nr:hypothetical protein [Roseomonas sp. ACRSG]